MLSQVRNTLKGAVAWFVIVLLILAFALFGVPQVSQLTGNAAITVAGKSFSSQYVQSEFNRVVLARRNESGGSFNQEDAIAAGLHDQVVNSISTMEALEQLSDKMNLSIPREIIRQYLEENEGFKNAATGEVDKNVLRTILQQNNITIEEFERRIGEDLKRNQLINAMATGAPAPNAYVESTLLRDTERREISYLIITEEMSGKAQEPTPDDLQTYYEQNASVFTAPEYRTFDLLVLRSENFRDGKTITEEELRRIYEANKARQYEKPETRTIYQLTYDTETEAQAALARLQQGEPFETVAIDKGLSLEAVTFADAKRNEILDPAVAEAAFDASTETGASIGPVRSLFGWTVVQVANVTAPETTSFEEARAEIESQYLDQDTRRAMLNAIDEIEEVRDTGASLADGAEAAGLQVETIGPIDRYSFAPGGAIIDKVPGEALSEIFSLEEDEETEALSLVAGDGFVFASLREITPPALKPFEDVRDDVERRWRTDERNRRISATVRSVREAIEGGQTLAEAAAQFDRTPTTQVIDRRFENDAISQPFNEQIFYASKGDLVSGPAAIGEAQIIASIEKVGFGMNTVPPDQRQLLGQYLGYQLDQEIVEAFVSAVRSDVDIKVNQSQLDAIFGQDQ
ncbi:MAG: peptidyl-prolyl cis-trans isomerase [Hyphococcus sp.]|nr:MAG: peptidyl-prolyl cis-trans isomerase [Marinicaulis sp.]